MPTGRPRSAAEREESTCQRAGPSVSPTASPSAAASGSWGAGVTTATGCQVPSIVNARHGALSRHSRACHAGVPRGLALRVPPDRALVPLSRSHLSATVFQ